VRNFENVEHLMRIQMAQLGDVGVVRFPWFFYDYEDLHVLSGKMRREKAVIVDLRGNHGGAVDTLKLFTGLFFDRDVKLYDRAGRKKATPETIKGEGHNAFGGRVIVLVDAESASAAEIFARVVQLEKRGTAIGDRSSGSVMTATSIPYSSSGVDYGLEVTIANLIMIDGQSLEHNGVTPDEVILPQATDLASGRDPVLAHAAVELGATISPEDAGKLFPYEWPKE
jgi:carboxyl-terminal processing protease